VRRWLAAPAQQSDDGRDAERRREPGEQPLHEA
jgi:hypothetical protein